VSSIIEKIKDAKQCAMICANCDELVSPEDDEEHKGHEIWADDFITLKNLGECAWQEIVM
jgi:hypothetical protein